jgi:hypothetical protein
MADNSFVSARKDWRNERKCVALNEVLYDFEDVPLFQFRCL